MLWHLASPSHCRGMIENILVHTKYQYLKCCFIFMHTKCLFISLSIWCCSLCAYFYDNKQMCMLILHSVISRYYEYFHYLPRPIWIPGSYHNYNDRYPGQSLMALIRAWYLLILVFVTYLWQWCFSGMFPRLIVSIEHNLIPPKHTHIVTTCVFYCDAWCGNLDTIVPLGIMGYTLGAFAVNTAGQ